MSKVLADADMAAFVLRLKLLCMYDVHADRIEHFTRCDTCYESVLAKVREAEASVLAGDPLGHEDIEHYRICVECQRIAL